MNRIEVAVIVNTDLTDTSAVFCSQLSCSHYNELYLAGLGPPEGQVMLIGRYCIVTGSGLTFRRPGSLCLARLLKGLAVPRLWPSSLRAPVEKYI